LPGKEVGHDTNSSLVVPMDISPSGLSGNLIDSWFTIQGVVPESKVEALGLSPAEQRSAEEQRQATQNSGGRSGVSDNLNSIIEGGDLPID